MKGSRSEDSRVQHLARLVEEDIRSRGLRTGDRYLTTHEVAALLGVSTRLANDAMGLLAARHVLTRRPKAGTQVGPAMEADEAPESQRPFDVVHLLIRQDFFFSERQRVEALVTGLAEAIPGCNIQFSFVPAFNELGHTERLVEANLGGRHAYLIGVKSPQVQTFFARQRLPAVLLGTPFEGITGLSSVDRDQREIGRILTRRLIEEGHRRIGVVLRDRRGQGDDLMMDAVTQEILLANLGSGALVVRSVPTDPVLTTLAVRQMLSTVDRPSALICRSRMIVSSTARACEELGLRVGRDLTLALCDPQTEETDVLPVPCIRLKAAMDAVSEGKLLARLLIEASAGKEGVARREVIAVSLEGVRGNQELVQTGPA